MQGLKPNSDIKTDATSSWKPRRTSLQKFLVTVDISLIINFDTVTAGVFST